MRRALSRPSGALSRGGDTRAQRCEPGPTAVLGPAPAVEAKVEPSDPAPPDATDEPMLAAEATADPGAGAQPAGRMSQCRQRSRTGERRCPTVSSVLVLLRSFSLRLTWLLSLFCFAIQPCISPVNCQALSMSSAEAELLVDSGQSARYR